MKKLLLLIGCSGFLLADLVLEITQGSEKAIKLAVLQVGESTFEGSQVIDIVNNDLRRTGEFEVLTTDQLLSIPSAEEDVIQRDWLLLEADAIIFLNVVTTDGVFDINYSIFDIRYKESVEKRKILGLPDSVRQTSHYVSDGIYEFFRLDSNINNSISKPVFSILNKNSIFKKYSNILSDKGLNL